MTKKAFTIISDCDGNIAFTVDAESTERAALAALNQLGWSVHEPKRAGDEDDDDA